MLSLPITSLKPDGPPPGPALTFIRLVDEVEQPLRLGLELGVSVLVGVVQHAQPPVRSLQLLRGGLGERPR